MRKTFDETVAILHQLGVDHGVEQDWRPKNPPRSPYPLPFFTNIHLPLNPSEWCSLVMREGEYYIGGCCGTTSYVQDIISHAFRFGSGWIEVSMLANIAEAMIGHEEGDPPNFKDGGDLDKAIEHFSMLDPWEKIATLWHLVKDYYVPEYSIVQPEDASEPRKAVQTLEHGLNYLSWHWVFERPSDDIHSMQNNVGETLVLHRILPALKMLYERIKELDLGPFEGYALCDKDTGVIAENGYGLCIFSCAQDAEKLMEQWRSKWALREDKRENEKPVDDMFQIRRVRVSMENGIEFLDQ